MTFENQLKADNGQQTTDNRVSNWKLKVENQLKADNGLWTTDNGLIER